MAVNLEIEDGNPWYLSPNVWVVPGNDPEGSPGMPVAGTPAYLWARVRNTGDTNVTNATVRFYWANPSVGFDRTTATQVGTAFVSLNAGQTSEVLCLTPWTPIYVNQGHECVLAEAFHLTSDPLPNSPVFNVPTDRHVAQRNLSVLETASRAFHFVFEIHNPMRKERTFTINAVQADIDQIENLIPLLGKNLHLPEKQGHVKRLGFVPSACPDAHEIEQAVPSLKALQVGPNGRIGYSLVGTLDGDAALVHVTQEEHGRVVGGLAVLVLHTEEGRK